MNFTLYTARTVGSKVNCVYPDKREIGSGAELAAAAKFDNVCAQYKKNYRNEENFLTSDVVVMDCDNDHSEEPSEWITPEKLDELLPDVAFAWAPSRHNNLPKGEKSARPRGHVYFPINPMTNPKQYAALKQRIYEAYPFFDDNALDAARFLFGAETGEVTWHDRWVYIDGMFPVGEETDGVPTPTQKASGNPGGSSPAAVSATAASADVDLFSTRHELRPYVEHADSKKADDRPVIPEGARNSTLHQYATRILKRFGEGEKTEQLFLEAADRCDPPLEEEELNAIWNSARKFLHAKVETQENYVNPEEYNRDFDTYKNKTLRPAYESDIDEGRAFVKEFGSEVRSTKETEWLRFDGCRWNESDRYAEAAMKEFMDMQLTEAEQMKQQAMDWLGSLGVTEEDVHRKSFGEGLSGEKKKAFAMLQSANAYLKFIRKRRDITWVKNALAAAESDVFGSINDMDVDPFLLNTPARTFDLHQGLAGGREHRAQDRITRMALADPGDQGEELWQNALNTFFCNDKNLIEYVQQIVGLAAIGKVYQEALIIAYGDGRNGKSTFWNTIRRVLGDYSGSLPADVLTGTYKQNTPALLAELKGQRLVIASELEEGLHLSTSMVKQLCSTDEINACKKFKQPFWFKPTHTLVLCTNHLPRVGAMDPGTWRRLIVIPFLAKLEGSEDILNYTDYLLENAAPAVMKWIIEGVEKIQKLNFHPAMPESVKAAIDDYRSSNNWLNAFLEECCDVGQGYTARSGELYTAYRMFCTRTNENARNTTDFYSSLEQAGFMRKKTNKGMLVLGLSMKTDFSE